MNNPGEHTVDPLTDRQRAVLVLISGYYRQFGEPPSIRFVARQLSLHPKTVQEHLDALCRKGWLRSPGPAGLRCTHQPS